jgi:hypothetical protein
MTSILKPALTALFVGAIAFTAIAQEEATKHDLDLRSSTWEAGDTVTFAVTSSSTENVEVAGPDGAVMMTQKETKHADWEAIVKAIDVDSAGRRTKCLVHFTKFSIKSEGVTSMGGQDQEKTSDDDSLAGVTIEIADGKWTAITPDATVSEIGKQFITTEFMKRHYVDDTHDVFAAHDATDPVAIGGTWTPDIAAYLSAIQYMAPLKCNAEKSVGSFTLKGIETNGDVEFAIVEGEHSIALMEFEQEGVPMAFGDGSTIASSQTTVVANSGRLRPFETKTRNVLEGTLNMGQAVSVKSEGEDTESMKIGGEIPSVREPKSDE